MIAALPGGVELAYEEAGAGPALLLVHGWPHDHTLWLPQLGGLSTVARCLAPDLRGFGNSSVTGPYSIDQYADDLAAFLDVTGVSQAVVCGLSMGGYVALAMYRRHRARVRGLILADTRASADSPEQRQARERVIALAEGQGVAALASQQVEKMVGATTRATRPELCAALEGMMARAPLQGVVGAQRAMMARPDATPLLATMHLPVLVVGGAEDVVTPPAEQRAMAAATPGARWVEIANAGHVSAYERPAAFELAVGEFLSDTLTP